MILLFNLTAACILLPIISQNLWRQVRVQISRRQLFIPASAHCRCLRRQPGGDPPLLHTNYVTICIVQEHGSLVQLFAVPYAIWRRRVGLSG
jgi:hypothetical protein